MTVSDVLSYLASGMSPQDVLAEFPYLTQDDIRACLVYAASEAKQGCSFLPEPNDSASFRPSER